MHSFFHRLIIQTQSIRSRPALAHGLAVALALGAMEIRFLIGDVLIGFPFLTFFPAITLATFLGGRGPGIVAAILGALLSDYFLIGQQGFAMPWPTGWIAMGFYTLTVSIIIAMTSGMLAALARLRANEAALEARVAERTAALSAEMTERGKVEAMVRQMQKMEAVGQLTGGVAHDFNNMLGIVIGSIEMARRRLTGAEHPQLSTSLDNATEGARRAATLVARLLAFSRQQPLQPSDVDANKLVAGMSDMLHRTLGEHVRIETVLAGGLWRCLADGPQLENAILNLAVNARDAMPDGGKLTIETANAHLDSAYTAMHGEVTPGQYVMVSVSDTGTGMTPQIMERAFDPFFTTKEVGKGTGLGLSQVFGYVKQSGGHVKIYSELGQGTALKIYLPRVTQATEVAAAAIEGQIPLGSKDILVLVVEDDAQMRATTVSSVLELGYQIAEAESGEDALKVLEQKNVTVLFTDVVMPGMSGKQLADAALVANPDLKVLFTTGYTRNAIVHNGVLDGGVALLTKPFTLAQLADKLRDALA